MKALLGIASLVGLFAAGPAVAADMPLKAPAAAPVYDWSGIYFGGSGGVGRLNTHWDFTAAGTFPSPNPTDDASWVGGGLVGIQWQTGNWVLGAEGNWIATGLETEATCPNPTFHCVTRLRDYWTAGARVGYVMWNGLFYATGGFAEGNIKTRAPAVATGVNLWTTSTNHPGWFIGTGSEFQLGSGFILGFEYDHVQFETKTHNPVPALPGDVHTIRADVDAFRARLTYKFNVWGSRY